MNKLEKPAKVCAGLGIGLIVLAIGLGSYFIQRDGWSIPESVIEEERSVYLQLRSDDPEQVARGRERVVEYDRAMKEILGRHPELQPEWKNVKPEDNGYLKLMQLAERYAGEDEPYEPTLGFPREIVNAINELEEWDVDTLRAYFLKEEDLVDEIRSIGLMPERSMAGTDIDSFFELYPANFIKQCADLLCLDARFAAKEGNKERALSSLLAAQGIAEHVCQIEAPSLIHETVGILVQLTVFGAAVHDVIADLGLTQDEISDLRKKLKPRTNRDMRRVIKGEFYVGTRALLMPYAHPVGNTEAAYIIPDLEILYDEYAESAKHNMKILSWLSMRGRFEVKENPWPYKLKSELSRPAREIVGDVSFLSFQVYGNGFRRTQIIYRYHDAVLAIAAGEEPPVELLTGEPFVFDPVTRELGLPDDELLEEQDINLVVVP